MRPISSFRATLLAIALVLTPAAPSLAAGGGDYDAGEKDSYWVKKAKYAISRDNFEGAYEILQKGVKNESNNADIHNLLGFSARKMERYADSEAHYQRALKLDPDHKGALEYMGELYLTLDRPDEAKALLARLDTICWLGCSELTKLEKAVTAWEEANN